MSGPVLSVARPAAHWWRDPIVWGFTAIGMAAWVVSSAGSLDWNSGLLYAGLGAGALLTVWMTRSSTVLPVSIAEPCREGWAVLAWYAAYVGLSLATRDGNLFGNEFAKYLWFIVVPVGMMLVLGHRGDSLQEVLRSVGVRREGLGRASATGLVAFVAVGLVLPFIIPDDQYDRLVALASAPLNLLLALPLSFGLSLVTAAVTEELFFRGVLQTRLAALLRSDVRACLAVALLFGLYHLPYAYFNTAWPTHGNLVWAVSSVIAEQAATGALLGLLWLRTGNLAAPVIFHALVNTMAVMTMLHFGQ